MEENQKSLSLKQAHGNPVKENEKKQKENTDRFSFDIDADNLSLYKYSIVLQPVRLYCIIRYVST